MLNSSDIPYPYDLPRGVSPDFPTPEAPDHIVGDTNTVALPTPDYYFAQIECGYCNGTFAVEFMYLEQVTNSIHCPLCCEELIVNMEG